MTRPGPRRSWSTVVRSWSGPCSRLRRDERGSLTVFVVAFALTLFVIAGLVIDGGLALNAKERITDDVEQAARAGADHLDLDRLRSGRGLVVQQQGAREAAVAFLRARGYTSGVQISVGPGGVGVRARQQRRTALLSLIFIKTITVTGQGYARPAVGITQEVAP